MSRRRGYVDARYLADVSRSTGGFKELTWSLMGARAGAVLLDAGCGSGEDTLPLGALVGARGRVIGVDVDRGLLRVARQRAAQAGLRNVEHRYAKLPKLPFPDATFDGVRSERVFQHLERPFESLAALARVTKPGGRVVVLEPDWASLYVDAGDRALERKVLQAGVDFAVNQGDIGRRLPGYFVRAGLVELDVQVHPIRYADLAAADHYILSGFEAAARRRVGARAMARWRTALETAQAEERFFAGFNYVLVSGRAPVARG